MIDIRDDICYAYWEDGVTQTWHDIADQIRVAWLFRTFTYVSIYSVMCYVGSQDSLDSFIYELTNEWGHP